MELAKVELVLENATLIALVDVFGLVCDGFVAP